jgi:hypothetical protein
MYTLSIDEQNNSINSIFTTLVSLLRAKMLTSDFGNYSENDSISTNSLTSDSFNLNSESSDFQGSEIDTPESIGSNERKVKSKARTRVQKKVKYWALPTMSSGTFNPSMLTARQQLQYLAQKSKLGEESDSLELSPLRLDRIKFEEMKSMAGNSSKDHEYAGNYNTPGPQPSSPSNRTNVSSSKSVRGSKLKEEISNSPIPPSKSKSKDTKESGKFHVSDLKQKNAKKVKISVENTETIMATISSESENIQRRISDTSSIAENIVKDTFANEQEAPTVILTKDIIETDDVTKKISSNTTNSNLPVNNETVDTTKNISDNIAIPNRPFNDLSSDYPLNSQSDDISGSNSLFDKVKTFLFDYQSHHRKHFENFIKDFANRLGLSLDDEVVKKKREEIMGKGMI